MVHNLQRALLILTFPHRCSAPGIEWGQAKGSERGGRGEGRGGGGGRSTTSKCLPWTHRHHCHRHRLLSVGQTSLRIHILVWHSTQSPLPLSPFFPLSFTFLRCPCSPDIARCLPLGEWRAMPMPAIIVPRPLRSCPSTAQSVYQSVALSTLQGCPPTSSHPPALVIVPLWPDGPERRWKLALEVAAWGQMQLLSRATCLHCEKGVRRRRRGGGVVYDWWMHMREWDINSNRNGTFLS